MDARSATGHPLGRVAAIAAASGATAFAARKALNTYAKAGSGDGAENGDRASSGGTSLLGAAVASGWEVAKDSVIPVVEDASSRVGSYLALRAPELLREVVVPKFIAGFEEARVGSRRSRAESDS